MDCSHLLPCSQAAHWVAPPGSPRRNQVSLFRRDIALDAVPAEAPIHLCADTRYRLWVNGCFAGAGPARFVPSHPEFDSLDLAPWLKQGDNAVVVELHFYGASSYQTMPGCREGFIAWGEVGGADLSTPGAWMARRSDAWDAGASRFSFAQGPLEICDTRRLPEAWYTGAAGEGWTVPVPVEGCPWGPLKARSIPLPGWAPVEPVALNVAGPLDQSEDIVGFRMCEKQDHAETETPIGKAFALRLRSAAAVSVELGLWWGRYYLNGKEITPPAWTGRGMRHPVRMDLMEGDNELCGWVGLLASTDGWDAVIGIPRIAGLEMGEEGFRISPLIGDHELAAWLVDGRAVQSAAWGQETGDGERLTPARRMAWLRMDERAASRDLKASDAPVFLAGPSGHVWSFDMGTEFVGHVEVEVEGAEGQVLDIGFDDWRGPDGRIDLYRTNPFVHSAERYILRGGRQRILGLNPRGGRFIEAVIHPAPGGERARLLALRIRDTRTLAKGKASFSADGDPRLQRIWNASVETLIGSTEDAYSDSPWRERGTYIGDFSVNQLIHPLVSAEMRIPKRALRVFAQAQREDGQLPAVAPAHHRQPHEDFTLIWLIALWEHWALTGDYGVVHELWPTVERIWRSPTWKADGDGLWAGEGTNVFLDWGVIKAERGGTANATLNAFRIAALEKSADLAARMGLRDRAEEWTAEAHRLREVFARVFWMDTEKRYAAYRGADGTLAQTPAMHANALAWAFEIGSEDQVDEVERYLFALLDTNFERGNATGQWGGHLELYFFRFVLEPMAERGHGARALDLIRRHWMPLLDGGYTTLPECFCRLHEGTGSRCHSWSAHPAAWLTRWVLGLRQAEPGRTDRWIVDPLVLAGIVGAKGNMPHAAGQIEVQWRYEAGTLRASIVAPPGVEVRAGRAEVEEGPPQGAGSAPGVCCR